MGKTRRNLLILLLAGFPAAGPQAKAAESDEATVLGKKRDRICFLSGSLVGPATGIEALGDQIRRYMDGARTVEECREELVRYCKAAIVGQGREVRKLGGYFRSITPAGPRIDFTVNPACEATITGKSE